MNYPATSIGVQNGNPSISDSDLSHLQQAFKSMRKILYIRYISIPFLRRVAVLMNTCASGEYISIDRIIEEVFIGELRVLYPSPLTDSQLEMAKSYLREMTR